MINRFKKTCEDVYDWLSNGYNLCDLVLITVSLGGVAILALLAAVAAKSLWLFLICIPNCPGSSP